MTDKIPAFFKPVQQIPDYLNQRVYPSLDGLRGVSIILVVLYHFVVKYTTAFKQLHYLGHLGVDIFFVISGFLITTLCIKEKIETHDLHLKGFYIRRFFRIIPVAYLFILVVLILNILLKLNIHTFTFLYSVLFMADFSFAWKTGYFSWYLSHYWSLSVEEQFYILFPILIKKRFEIFIAAILAVVFCVPVLFYLQTVVPALNNGMITAGLRYLIKFQGIGVGCLFSVIAFQGFTKPQKFGLVPTVVALLVPLLVRYNEVVSPASASGNLLISIAIGIVIISNIQPRNNFIFKALNWYPLAFIGKLSYSIYIWQQLFLANDARLPVSLFPYNLIFLIVVPYLSYFYYEKFFLKFKSRFKRLPQTKQKNTVTITPA